jgi:hypothetical protein
MCTSSKFKHGVVGQPEDEGKMRGGVEVEDEGKIRGGIEGEDEGKIRGGVPNVRSIPSGKRKIRIRVTI